MIAYFSALKEYAEQGFVVEHSLSMLLAFIRERTYDVQFPVAYFTRCVVQIVVGAQLPRSVGSEYIAHSPKDSSCLPAEAARCTSRVHAVFAFGGRESRTAERQTFIAAETKAALISVNSCLFLAFRGDKKCVLLCVFRRGGQSRSTPGTLDLAAYSHAYRVLKKEEDMYVLLVEGPGVCGT